MRVGRYKFNKKLSIATRINQQIAAEDIVDPSSGEVMVKKGDRIDLETARAIQNAGVNEVWLDCEGNIRKVIGNNFVDASCYLPFNPKEAGILEMVHLPTLKKIMESVEPDQLLEAVKENVSSLVPKHIIADDIVASISYLLGLPYGLGFTDDIDHLGNRRLRSVGEAAAESDPHWSEPSGARGARAHEHSGFQRRASRRPDQHSPGQRGHQGIFRFLSVEPVHGSAQPAG